MWTDNEVDMASLRVGYQTVIPFELRMIVPGLLWAYLYTQTGYLTNTNEAHYANTNLLGPALSYLNIF
jgi:hypothetical protein